MAPVTPAELAADVVRALRHRLGLDPERASDHDWLAAAIAVARDRIADTWVATRNAHDATDAKRVNYLSLEFLIGRLTTDALSNLGILDTMRAALAGLGVDLDAIVELEPDAALGNGGLGRLAAGFMESMATLGVPAYGYGIRYENGMFRQEIADGQQIELPESWLDYGNPWEYERREYAYEIGFGGWVEPATDDAGVEAPQRWHPADHVLAAAYDTPIVGWRADRVITLRLWSAKPIDPMKLDRFNAGDYSGALAESNRAEVLSRVLYPADSHLAGQELRLRQEYFFTAASLADIVARHLRAHPDLSNLADHAAVHLNDTHPAIAVAELMRILIDEHGYDFDAAWEITRATTAYTNHTLLPEALESWPVGLFESILPRQLQLIYAINARLLDSARSAGIDDGGQIAGISLIDEGGERRVRMGNLAFVGSHSVNGVSELHTDLMRRTVFADLNQLYPGRINAKTNGVTPRRWLFESNPGLTALITEAIGPGFMDDLGLLANLETVADDAEFQSRFRVVKRANKVRLAELAVARQGLALDPGAIFDIQVKRIHEYKRQLLNVFHAVSLYHRLIDDPATEVPARVKFFGGKAAPSYYNAKLIIRLINDVAATVRADERVSGRLEIVFLANYNVSLAEVMMPAADLSEQISTAGFEASGTGNMKFALGGALTIGTLDGANIEIRDRVGDDNIVIFGLTADEVTALRRGGYRPGDYIEADAELGRTLDAIASGAFSPDEPGRYRQLVDGIRHSDPFMLAADFAAYVAAQGDVERRWDDAAGWDVAAIRNTAHSSYFSSDRTIAQYADDIWHVPHER